MQFGAQIKCDEFLRVKLEIDSFFEKLQALLL